MLIRRRIENHEKRIKNENKSNKVIYDVGDRVRIQDVKKKQFSKNGTVTEQRRTDSGTIVSYLIKNLASEDMDRPYLYLYLYFILAFILHLYCIKISFILHLY